MTCYNPFIEFRVNTLLFTVCCPPWVDPATWLGDWATLDHPSRHWSPWEIWNCEPFQELRRAVLRGDYQQFCRTCSRVIAHHVERDHHDWMKPVMERPPQRILLEHDRTCQLQCPSCRAAYLDPLPRHEQRHQQVMQILDEFLPTCEQLSLMSSGEPFASPSTREIFLRVNRLPEPPKIWLMTNGLLMPREWPLYWNLHDRLEWIFQSIDAATAQTYEAVRRPATWQQLEKSFRYLEAIRREHPFSWQLNFVVQAANFHEMPRFVQLGIDLGATTVHFARILRLYHSQDQFSEMDVCAESHPQHQPFLRTIEHPIMKHSIVLAPTIQEFMA